MKENDGPSFICTAVKHASNNCFPIRERIFRIAGVHIPVKVAVAFALHYGSQVRHEVSFTVLAAGIIVCPAGKAHDFDFLPGDVFKVGIESVEVLEKSRYGRIDGGVAMGKRMVSNFMPFLHHPAVHSGSVLAEVSDDKECCFYAMEFQYVQNSFCMR